MEIAQKKIEYATIDIGATVRNILLFCGFAGLCWWAANDFSVAAQDGFDPLRYQYYAQYGLPTAYLESSSYRIVLVLEYLYMFLPPYYGYLAAMAIICYGVRYYDYNRIVSIAVFSPITFYYIGQTGKDGIAILAAIAAATLITSRKNFGMLLFCGVVITLSLYVRPAVVLILPIVLVQFRFGTAYAIVTAIIMGIAFAVTTDTYSVLSGLDGIADDEGSGQLAQTLRRFTFGYEIEALSAKFLLLSLSMFFQPLLGFVKFYFGSQLYVLFEGLCFFAFVFILYRGKCLRKFVISALPYVIIIGVSSPFYHFRYLAVAYPVIWAYCRYANGWGFASPRSVSKPSNGNSNATFAIT